MADVIGPVPPALVAGAPPDQVPATLQWANDLIKIIERDATTALAGRVKQTAAIADLNQTITDPPTQSEVQAISDKVDAMLAGQRTSGQLEDP